MTPNKETRNYWPELTFENYKDTLSTVHLWSQIVGKIRLKKSPWINHSWHVTLYVSAKGLTTGSIPYENGIFEIAFDFIQHRLEITSSEGKAEQIDLYPRTVADFYKTLFQKLQIMNIQAFIHAAPNEMDPAIPFDKDEIHKAYDPEQMQRLWKALIPIHNVFLRFRADFGGKCSPVHLFWGAFDLAVTRFSGRKAPEHQGGVPNMPLKVMQEAYSHEVSSCGFWFGNDAFPRPCFYAYAYPATPEYAKQIVRPEQAFYSEEMGEFLLPYDAIKDAENPEQLLLDFMNSTFEAAVATGDWDSNLKFNFDAVGNADRR